MKKFFFAFLINTILICSVNADMKFINKHFSQKGKELDKIEGIWLSHDKQTRGYVGIYKYGAKYVATNLGGEEDQNIFWFVQKTSPNNFSGTCELTEITLFLKNKVKHKGLSLTVNQFSDDSLSWNCSWYIRGHSGVMSTNYTRTWPANLKTYNKRAREYRIAEIKRLQKNDEKRLKKIDKKKFIPSINLSSSKAASYWWVVFILIALAAFIYTQLKPGKSKKVKIPKSKISFQKNPIFTFIPKLWRGEFPLAISFWVFISVNWLLREIENI